MANVTGVYCGVVGAGVIVSPVGGDGSCGVIDAPSFAIGAAPAGGAVIAAPESDMAAGGVIDCPIVEPAFACWSDFSFRSFTAWEPPSLFAAWRWCIVGVAVAAVAMAAAIAAIVRVKRMIYLLKVPVTGPRSRPQRTGTGTVAPSYCGVIAPPGGVLLDDEPMLPGLVEPELIDPLLLLPDRRERLLDVELPVPGDIEPLLMPPLLVEPLLLIGSLPLGAVLPMPGVEPVMVPGVAPVPAEPVVLLPAICALAAVASRAAVIAIIVFMADLL